MAFKVGDLAIVNCEAGSFHGKIILIQRIDDDYAYAIEVATKKLCEGYIKDLLIIENITGLEKLVYGVE
jgi:hypothetical protein